LRPGGRTAVTAVAGLTGAGHCGNDSLVIHLAHPTVVEVRDEDIPLGIECQAIRAVHLCLGAGAAVWGHPAASVAWLANKLATFGIALEAGEIILSGALTAAVDARQGDYFHVAFQELGSVGVRFI
jgi:2-keto-4-pentenoate hydratase